MGMTHTELRVSRREAKRRISDFGFRNAEYQSGIRNLQSAFTLTELLVVITIIAILASLITAGAMTALRRAKEAAITMEIDQLGSAIERFKNETGGAYPPNAMNDLTVTVAVNDFVRSFRKAFPRHAEPDALLQRLAGAGTNPLVGGMTGAEAVYFWLGGFSSDPVYPISGPGGPSFGDGPDSGNQLDLSDEVLESRTRLYEFDLGRLGPRTDQGQFRDVDNGGVGRYIEYDDPQTGNPRRINLWTYTAKGTTQPFIYFDASRYDPATYDLNLAGYDPDINTSATPQAIKSAYLDSEVDFVFALKKLREGVTAPASPTDIVFVNKGKFQILHSGLDSTWGSAEDNPAGFWGYNSAEYDETQLVRFPAGPFTGDIADTLTNFTGGTLESAQE